MGWSCGDVALVLGFRSSCSVGQKKKKILKQGSADLSSPIRLDLGEKDSPR